MTGTKKKKEVELPDLDDLKLSPIELAQKYGTKSNAIRALRKQGLNVKQISVALRIRYQHVRNVLVRKLKRTQVYQGARGPKGGR